MSDKDAINGALKGSQVFGQNSEGVVFSVTLLRLTRLVAVFELYNPTAVLRFSESLSEFKISFNERVLYAGKAVVRNLLSTGSSVVVCEVTLNETAWCNLDFAAVNDQSGGWGQEYQTFLKDWQKLYKVRPEFKLVLADMQTYFTDLRLWLNQFEVGLAGESPSHKAEVERSVVEELAISAIPSINDLFEQFETVANPLEPEVKPAHENFMRRQLHPLLLCSPFAYRTFYKPLGYAGDYEMVNMIIRNSPEGGSLFAKLVHTWFVRQPPALAHRNRINYLIRKISEEALRMKTGGREVQVFNLACGPAMELQQFLAESSLRNLVKLTLLDFNEETLSYIRAIISQLAVKHNYTQPVQYIKKSVHHLLKEGVKTSDPAMLGRYDLVYCAGLFDYLSNSVCQRILNVMYDWVSPGGLLVVTNVDPSNPMRNGMEHLLDWHLIYRTGADLRKLKPEKALADETKILSDSTGVNVFMEVRKPNHV